MIDNKLTDKIWFYSNEKKNEKEEIAEEEADEKMKLTKAEITYYCCPFITFRFIYTFNHSLRLS